MYAQFSSLVAEFYLVTHSPLLYEHESMVSINQFIGTRNKYSIK